jgi:hypothetical protein
MTPLPHGIDALAASLASLAQQAAADYAPLVEATVSERSQDVQRIERLLDGLLDFCFDPAALLLYKELCRHYYAIDPAAAIWYVNAYRASWDPEASA